MTKDFSSTFAGKQQVRGRSVASKFECMGFLTRRMGVAIVALTLCTFSGTMVMGWLIKTGLDDLAYKKEVKLELVKVKQDLVMKRQELLTLDNIEVVAGGLGLYPGLTQVRQL